MTVNEIKALKQQEANAAIDNNGEFGLIAMATGTGKSKVGVDRATKIIKDWNKHVKIHLSVGNLINVIKPKILLVVPTEKLRDEGWKEEFTKWNVINIWEQDIERTCYASLDNYESEDWDLVILDRHLFSLNLLN